MRLGNSCGARSRGRSPAGRGPRAASRPSTRIAHWGFPTWTCWKSPVAPVGAQPTDAVGAARRVVVAAQPHPAQVQAAVVGEVIAGRISPAAVWIEKRVAGPSILAGAGTGPPRGPRCPDSSASEPSGLKIRRRATKPGSRARTGAGCRRRGHPGVGRAQAADPGRGELEGQRRALDDQVVVAERLPLLEVHAGQCMCTFASVMLSRALSSAKTPLVLLALVSVLSLGRAVVHAGRAVPVAVQPRRRAHADLRRGLLRQRGAGDRRDSAAAGGALRRRAARAPTPTPSTRSWPS